MKKTIFTFIGLLLFINITAKSANIEWKSGKIITNQGDTIHGTLGYRNGVGDWSKCIFKENTSDPASTYMPSQIKGYIYDSGAYYESIILKINGLEIKCFAECLVKGTISLYYLEKNEREEFESYYSLNALDGKSAPIPAESKSYKQREKIKRTLWAIFNFNPKMEEYIKKMDYSRSSFVDLFKKYHDLTCSESVCITYQEPKYKSKFYITPYIGAQLNMTHYNASVEKESSKINNYTPLLGVNFQMNLNKKSDRKKLNFGLNVSQIKMGHDKEPVFIEDFKAIQIANNIGAEFQLMGHKIRPFFEIGLAQFLVFDIQNKNNTVLKNPITGDDDFYFKKTPFDTYSLGYYLSSGIIIPLKNDRAIPIKMTFAKYVFGAQNDNINLSIGYTFRLR